MSNVLSENVSLAIYDGQGRVILNNTVSALFSEIHFSWDIPATMTPGLYYVQIVDQNTVKTEKFFYVK